MCFREQVRPTVRASDGSQTTDSQSRRYEDLPNAAEPLEIVAFEGDDGDDFDIRTAAIRCTLLL